MPSPKNWGAPYAELECRWRNLQPLRTTNVVSEKTGNQHSEPRTLFDLRGSEGVNESERLLVTLCRKSFLRLWAQANNFTDEGFHNGRGATKELCDALVVFGNDVLIMSDKHVEFQRDRPLDVAWPRWYRRAVAESVRQLFGARNWLRRFPHRAYLDVACTRPLPVPIPTDTEIRFHLIAVTRGCRDAAIAARGGDGLGSLALNTGVHGDQHLETPFTFGQPDPAKGFVHAFDEVTVELLMSELDTAPDFIGYLKERERVLGHPGTTLTAAGEEDLLALYLQTMDEKGERHCLPVLDGETPPDLVVVDDTLFRNLQTNPAYQRKKEADRISYEWDRMIDRFIECGDPAIHEAFVVQPPNETEQGLRLLAAEDRFRRRQLADAFIGAMKRVGPGDRIGRVVYGGVADESVFVFVVVPKRDAESYEEYRKYRVALLHAYCRIAKLQAPLGTVFVGVGFDNPHKNYPGGSEDLFVYTQKVWTAEDLAELERKRDELQILGPNMQIGRMRGSEFPNGESLTADAVTGMRWSRNEAERRRRKKKKSKQKARQASQRRNRQ